MDAPRRGLLRHLATLLIRGPGAEYIRADLEDALERDLARGMSRPRAWRRFLVNLVASAMSAARARTRFPFSWLDVKLGVRNLIKRPGLTAVSLFALGVGIPVGLAPGQATEVAEAPLPVDEGERIRFLRTWNVATSRPGATTSYDLARWRRELSSFEMLGATRFASYNLDADGGGVEPVAGAEMTGSMFDILRVPPTLGRTLDAADELPGGPEVMVLGHDVWRARFGGDPGIVGRTVPVNGIERTVVGVMPAGFLFPVRQSLWLPLRDVEIGHPDEGRPLLVLGRLRDGIPASEAQSEIEAAGQRLAAEFPETHAALGAQAVGTSFLFFGLPRGGFRALPEYRFAQILTLALLSVACANVGMLIFARTTARTTELAIRTALGASRSRIVGQIFTESLVLAVLAAGVGLVIVDWLPIRLLAAANIAHLLPYWIDPGVTAGAAMRALSLAVFSAVVAGVIPAYKVTRGSIQWNVQSAQAGQSGKRFGGVSSALIVADVAIAVIVVGFAIGIWDLLTQVRDDREAAGMEAAEYLSVRLDVPLDAAIAGVGVIDRDAHVARIAETQQELVRRLLAEPGIRGVAVGDTLPRMTHNNPRIEIEGVPTAWDDADVPRALMARVDPGFFEGFGKRILTGRGFDPADLVVGGSAAIVNTSFVERHLGGRNAIGKRFRYLRWGDPEPSRWHEIVGVVDRLGMHMLRPVEDEGFYLPAAPGELRPLRMAIHVGDDPGAFLARLRTLTREIDPVAVIRQPAVLDTVYEGDWYIMGGVVLGGAFFIAVLLAMAASGLYAIMSFSVSQRTREIGVRAALGARRASIAFLVARRSLAQILLGVLIGLPLAGRIFFEVADDAGAGLAVVATASLGIGVMLLVSLVACAAPTIRALRILPTEALRE